MLDWPGSAKHCRIAKFTDREASDEKELRPLFATRCLPVTRPSQTDLESEFRLGRHSGYNAAMTLRFQFSLRALMAAVAIAALCLGAWQGYKARIAEFVRAESAQVGQPIVLSGRFWLQDEAASGRFEIGVDSRGKQNCVGGDKIPCGARQLWHVPVHRGGKLFGPASMDSARCM